MDTTTLQEDAIAELRAVANALAELGGKAPLSAVARRLGVPRHQAQARLWGRTAGKTAPAYTLFHYDATAHEWGLTANGFAFVAAAGPAAVKPSGPFEDVPDPPPGEHPSVTCPDCGAVRAVRIGTYRYHVRHNTSTRCRSCASRGRAGCKPKPVGVSFELACPDCGVTRTVGRDHYHKVVNHRASARCASCRVGRQSVAVLAALGAHAARVSAPPPDPDDSARKPTVAKPGSPEKVAVLCRRAELYYAGHWDGPICLPGDAGASPRGSVTARRLEAMREGTA